MATSVSIGKKPDPVTLTDLAASKVAQLLAQEDGEGLALRVAVRPGGCSGYSYEMFFDTEVADDDVVREFGTVRVVVDPASAELLTRRHPRLQRRAAGGRVPHHQPQRHPHLRLRVLLQLISLPTGAADRRRSPSRSNGGRSRSTTTAARCSTSCASRSAASRSRTAAAPRASAAAAPSGSTARPGRLRDPGPAGRRPRRSPPSRASTRDVARAGPRPSPPPGPASAASARPGSSCGWPPSSASRRGRRGRGPDGARWPTCAGAPAGRASSRRPALAIGGEPPAEHGRTPRPRPAARRLAGPARGPASQASGPDVVLGGGGFADDRAPAERWSPCRDRDGGCVVGDGLAEARAGPGKVQGRNRRSPSPSRSRCPRGTGR